MAARSIGACWASFVGFLTFLSFVTPLFVCLFCFEQHFSENPYFGNAVLWKQFEFGPEEVR